MKKQKCHPYKYSICQALKPSDLERRRLFCEWYTRKSELNVRFSYQILWSDESRFTNNGIFNRKNVHYWSSRNPRVGKALRQQDRFGFSVWGGIFGTKIVGPFIYHHNLTSESYLHLLQNFLEDALDDMPPAVIRNCWIQQDGAPAHNARVVREYL